MPAMIIMEVQELTEYELLREARMAQNRARLAALGLPQVGRSHSGSHVTPCVVAPCTFSLAPYVCAS